MKPSELHPTRAALGDDDGRAAYQPPNRRRPSYAERGGAPLAPNQHRLERSIRQQRYHKRRAKKARAIQMRIWADNAPPSPDFVAALERLRAAGWTVEPVRAQMIGADNKRKYLTTYRVRYSASGEWHYPAASEDITWLLDSRLGEAQP